MRMESITVTGQQLSGHMVSRATAMLNFLRSRKMCLPGTLSIDGGQKPIISESYVIRRTGKGEDIRFAVACNTHGDTSPAFYVDSIAGAISRDRLEDVLRERLGDDFEDMVVYDGRVTL